MSDRAEGGRRPSTLEIYERLKEDIIQLRYAPGCQISEHEIALRFSVSRTPVKACFIRLETEGFIVVKPKSGSFVSLLDPQEVEESIYLRSLLEADMVRQLIEELQSERLALLRGLLEAQRQVLAQGRPELGRPLRIQTVASEQETQALQRLAHFVRLDDDFHACFFRWAGHERLWAGIRRLELHYQRFRQLDIQSSGVPERILEEHQAIYERLEARDYNGYLDLLQQHLYGNVRRLLGEQKERYARYFLSSEEKLSSRPWPFC